MTWNFVTQWDQLKKKKTLTSISVADDLHFLFRVPQISQNPVFAVRLVNYWKVYTAGLGIPVAGKSLERFVWQCLETWGIDSVMIIIIELFFCSCSINLDTGCRIEPERQSNWKNLSDLHTLLIYEGCRRSERTSALECKIIAIIINKLKHPNVG